MWHLSLHLRKILPFLPPAIFCAIFLCLWSKSWRYQSFLRLISKHFCVKYVLREWDTSGKMVIQRLWFGNGAARWLPSWPFREHFHTPPLALSHNHKVFFMHLSVLQCGSSSRICFSVEKEFPGLGFLRLYWWRELIHPPSCPSRLPAMGPWHVSRYIYIFCVSVCVWVWAKKHKSQKAKREHWLPTVFSLPHFPRGDRFLLFGAQLLSGLRARGRWIWKGWGHKKVYGVVGVKRGRFCKGPPSWDCLHVQLLFGCPYMKGNFAYPVFTKLLWEKLSGRNAVGKQHCMYSFHVMFIDMVGLHEMQDGHVKIFKLYN